MRALSAYAFAVSFLFACSTESPPAGDDDVPVPDPGTDAPAATGTPDPGLEGPPFSLSDPKCTDANGRIDCTDVVYSEVDGRSLHLDIHAPSAAKTGKVPVIIYFHPGGWMSGSYHAMAQVSVPEQLARGYAVLLVEYRLTLDNAKQPTGIVFPDNLRDAKTAVRWARIKGASWIDADRIVAMGASAGAHLGAMIATTPDRPELDGRGDPSVPTSVKAFVGLATVLDFSYFVPSNPPLVGCPNQPPGQDAQQGVSLLIGGDLNDAQYAPLLTTVAPVTYIGPSTPPFLTFSGTCDQTVPHEGAVDLQTRAVQQGLSQVQVVIVDGAFHDTTLDDRDAKQAFDSFLDAQLR